jgi:16S rRNA (guanine527-N7)-methyltransferase
VALDSGQLALFSRLLDCLTADAARVNLTAIREPREIVHKHFLDSLAGARLVGAAAGQRLIDVGSGAGFPGLPLKIARPGLAVTLLESNRKKAAFLRRTVSALGLEGIRVLAARAEDAGRDPDHRAGYHYAVARAVAEIRVLAEYCLPFLRPGGLFLAYKGPGVREELGRADGALRTLGGSVREVLEFELPGEKARRSLVVIKKTGSTPERFPRRPGIPTKRPLS